MSVLGLPRSGTSLERVTCFDCGDRVEHCHGTLIRHTRDVSECAEPECTVPEVACHALVIDCDELACAWCGPTRVRRAA